MKSYVVSKLRWFLSTYDRIVCLREFKNQANLRPNERPIEYAFVLRKIRELYPKRILDVGTGTTALPHIMRNCGIHVTASDNIKDYWPGGMTNRHYHVINDDITKTTIRGKFDLITCISAIEHIRDFESAFKNMVGLLDIDGCLVVTFPSNGSNYVENVYDLPDSSYGKGNPYITQSFSPNEIGELVRTNDLKVVDQEYWKFWTGVYWTQGSQVIPPRKVEQTDSYQLTCLAVVKNRPV